MKYEKLGHKGWGRILWLRVVFSRFWARLRHAFRLKELFLDPYESCNRCGSVYRLVGDWSDKVWIAVVGHEGGLLCPSCFVELANQKGINLTIDDVQKIWVFQDGDSFDVYNVIEEK